MRKEAVAGVLIVLIVAGLAVGYVATSNSTRNETSSTSASTFTYQTVISSASLEPGTSEAPTCAGSENVSLSLGEPITKIINFSYEGGSTTFPATENVPLTVTSAFPVKVCLSAVDVPTGVWLHFDPQVVEATPNGTVAQIVLAGAVEAPHGGSSTVILQATNGTSPLGSLRIELDPFQQMAVMNSIGPLGLLTATQSDPSGTQALVQGAVYDPSVGSNSSISVAFSVDGMLNSSDDSMPFFLTVTPLNATMILSPDVPAYFSFAVRTSSAPPGTYQIRIGEEIEGQTYHATLTVDVYPFVNIH